LRRLLSRVAGEGVRETPPMEVGSHPKGSADAVHELGLCPTERLRQRP